MGPYWKIGENITLDGYERENGRKYKTGSNGRTGVNIRRVQLLGLMLFELIMVDLRQSSRFIQIAR